MSPKSATVIPASGQQHDLLEHVPPLDVAGEHPELLQHDVSDARVEVEQDDVSQVEHVHVGDHSALRREIGRVASAMIQSGPFKVRIETCDEGFVASVTAEFRRR
jgi:hypothetical protein